MNNIIKNPSADQLEAGGKVSGIYRALRFTGEVLEAEWGGEDLFIGSGVWVRRNGRLDSAVTVTEYEPPEPPPVWQTAKDDEWLAYEYVGLNGVPIGRASQANYFRHVWRNQDGTLDSHLSDVRRVILADPDTQVVVPKDALDKLLAETARPDAYLAPLLTAAAEVLSVLDEAADQ